MLGDIIWMKFESTEPALEAYQSALKVHDRNESAVLARQRIDFLREDKVVVFGR
jgi:hypothetical protein